MSHDVTALETDLGPARTFVLVDAFPCSLVSYAYMYSSVQHTTNLAQKGTVETVGEQAHYLPEDL